MLQFDVVFFNSSILASNASTFSLLSLLSPLTLFFMSSISLIKLLFSASKLLISFFKEVEGKKTIFEAKKLFLLMISKNYFMDAIQKELEWVKNLVKLSGISNKLSGSSKWGWIMEEDQQAQYSK